MQYAISASAASWPSPAFSRMLAGLKPDGTRKVRAVDHMTQSQVNPSTVVKEKMGHESLDLFFGVMRALMMAVWVSQITGITCKA